MDRLKKLGIALSALGVVFLIAGGFAYLKVGQGYNALGKYSEAQNVSLNYNEDGKLLDRGTTEQAEAILALLTEDWGYTIDSREMDPNDPLVNSASEYMYQLATITYHTLHGTQKVTLAEDVEYEGETFEAGTYDFPVDGRYWTGFNRAHPIEGKARDLAWTGTAHGLIAQLGVGAATHSALKLGFALVGVLVGLGVSNLLAGLGLIWAAKEE